MMSTAIVFGDSIACGYYDTENLGWVNLLNKEFMEKDLYFNNRAVSGDTTELMKTYFEADFKAVFRAVKPALVILAMGVNDTLCDGKKLRPWVPIEKFETNYKEFLRFLKLNNCKIIILGLTNVDESKTTPVSWEDVSYYNKLIQQYNQKLKEIAQKEKVQFIDLFGLLENDDLFDGIHPNTKGHQKIFQKVKEIVEQLRPDLKK